MAERHAKNSSQYGWGRIAVLLSVIFIVQVIAPAAASEDSFDDMGICDDSNSDGIGGVCDLRYDADDQTTGITSWVEGMFHFNMTSPTQIQFQASWAIREWDKMGMEIFTSGDLAELLTWENINADDGLPADVLRSAFDESTDPDDPSSPTIQDSLLTEIDGSISGFLANWGGSSSPDTSWQDRVFLPDDSGVVSAVDCMMDPTMDSNGNAFEPPVCISTNVNITLAADTTYGLDNAVSPTNLNTALEGLLVMGSQITTNFDVKVEPGHKGTYSIHPPSYATVTDASGWGFNEEVPEDGGAYSSGLWTVDNRNDPNGLAPNPRSADLDMTIGMRDSSTTGVVEVSPDDKSLDLRVLIDLSDESNAFVEVVAGIYQIQSSSLDSWGISDLLMPADKANIPVITSDGIRMAYHTGLLSDLDELSSNIPISGIGQALASSKEGLSVEMGDFQWIHVSSAPLDQGGLNYTHSPSQCVRGVNYCMEGTVAMDDTYPVYMRSGSNVFPFSLADLLGGNLGDSGFMNSVSGDDLSKLLNSGLEFSTVLSDEAMETFVGSLLPNGISADLTMEILLPSWASTPQGGDSIVLSYRASGSHSGAIGLAGSDSFYWNHPICKDTVPSSCFDGGGDTVCPSTSKSCAYLDVDMDLGKVSFASLPLSKGVTVDFALSVDIVVHRIAVPDALFDSLNSESTSIGLDVLPSDLLRALLDIGSRGNPLEVEFDLCDDPARSYCKQKMPISSSQSSGLPWYVDELEKDIKSLIDDKARELTEEEGNGFGNIDMSGFSIDIEFPYEMITDNDDVIGDERGIVLSVNIPKVSVTAGVDNSWAELIGILRGDGGSLDYGLVTEDVSMVALASPFVTPMIAAMDSLTGALSTSMVSPSPEGVRVQGASASLPTSQLANIGPDSLGLSFAGSYTITMPLGMELENLSTQEGKISSEINNDSRQVITYTISQGMGDDVVSFTLLLTPMWVISQVQFYIMGLLAFMLWRVRRRMTKRKRQKRARALEALEEMASSPIGYIAPQPTVEVLQVTDNGIVIKRRLSVA